VSVSPRPVGRSRSESIDRPVAAPPFSIYSVLASPCLKEAFKWHSVSCFAFENFFFVQKIDSTWRSLFVGFRNNTAIKACADDILRTFIDNSAPWEISLSSQVRNKLAEVVQNMKVNQWFVRFVVFS
jgi:hypothetical protein